MRKSYTAAQKAKIALEAIRGDRSLAELASRHGVHATQIRQWKKKLVEDVPSLFSDKRRRQAKDNEVEKSKLFEEIGRLKVELDWLKKKDEQFDC